mgnify:FL=1
MRNLHLTFSHPWLLLLLLPAIAFTLIPYFRLAKRYRRTRSRITSMVLHMIVMVMAVLTLSGLNFRYEKVNKNNEIILLVDVSATENDIEKDRDEFVEKVIEESKDDNFKVGVVLFGYDQVYAAKLDTNTDKIIEEYRDALKNNLPDTTATDIAAALRYAKDLFETPDSSKIVLVSDGKQTDEEALNVIRYVSAQGTKVDTVYFGSNANGTEAAVTAIELPDKHIVENEECSITATIEINSAEIGKNVSGKNYIYADLYVNGELSTTKEIRAEVGKHKIAFEHTFTMTGLNKVEVKLNSDGLSGDTIFENNSYCSYVYLQVFNKILIIEKTQGMAEEFNNAVKERFNEEDETNVDVVAVASGDVPTDLDGLRKYHQIILNNISNSDLEKIAVSGKTNKDAFVRLLYSYVYDYGGGLLTLGGKEDDNETSHAYYKDDMSGTLFQDMLPVEATDYSAPLGVVVAVDISGSMENGNLKSQAFQAAANLVSNILSPDRDYIGIATFAETATERVPMTSAAKKREIVEKIAAINESADDGGSTGFTNAIKIAGDMLQRAALNVSKKHVIIITDGAPTDEASEYLAAAAANYSNDITLSIVIIGPHNEGTQSKMEELTAQAGGSAEGSKVYFADVSNLSELLIKDIKAPEIKNFNPEKFNPVISNMISNVVRNLPRETDEEGNPTDKMAASIGGFYGTRLKNGATKLLDGIIIERKTVDGKEVKKEYQIGVPLYAEWSFGKGKVGSFMSDVYGDWGSEFIASEAGKLFLYGGEVETTNADGVKEIITCPGVINSLMPVEDNTVKEIQIKTSGDNYYRQMNVLSDLKEGETISGEIARIEKYGTGTETESEKISLNSVTTDNNSPVLVATAIGEENSFGRCVFSIKEAGVYRITLKKLDKNGNEVYSVDYYQVLSYSSEYNIFDVATEDELKEFMASLADKGKGGVIDGVDDTYEIFRSFITGFKRNFDPRTLFMIIAIVAFLLDIAVRKFKFKWIHEIIRDHKAKQAEKEKSKVQ